MSILGVTIPGTCHRCGAEIPASMSEPIAPNRKWCAKCLPIVVSQHAKRALAKREKRRMLAIRACQSDFPEGGGGYTSSRDVPAPPGGPHA